MTEPGAISTIAKTEDELVPELLVAQRGQLQNEINDISNRLESASQTLSPEQAEQLEHLRETRDNLMTQVDKIDALLAKENPDVLSEQAANLPSARPIEDSVDFDMSIGSNAKLEIPTVQTKESTAEIKAQPEVEDTVMAKLDQELLDLTREVVRIIQESEDKRIDLEKQKNEALEPINARKKTLLQEKTEYLRLRRQMNEVERKIKNI